MIPVSKHLYWAVMLCAAAGAAAAQDPPPQTPAKSAQSDAGEPRANAAPAAAGAAADAPADPVATSPAPPPRTAAKAAAATRANPAAGGAGQKNTGAADHLNLGTATVTGDREQPKVMYIVPWKSANIGDLSGKPMNSLLDEALAPVDRDEFKREVAYYDAVRARVPQNGAAAAQQGEK